MDKKLTKKAKSQPYKTKHKHRQFIREYLINGMNASAAYAKVYKKKKGRNTESAGCQLLRNLKVINELSKQLELIDWNINDKYVIKEITDILTAPDTKKGDKIRALDLLSNIIGAKRPQEQVSINIYKDVQAQTDKILQEIEAE